VSALPGNAEAGVPPEEVLRVKSESGFHPSNVYRRGDVVIKDAHPWTRTVHTLLRHLEEVGFEGAPRIVGSGFDDSGHETVTFIEGEFTQPGPWTLEGAASTGHLLRRLHDATATYRPPPDAIWKPVAIRSLGSHNGATRIISHCDVAPWNVVARSGRAVALIDWDYAGPVDPIVELAMLCWLNAKLHDDVVAAREGLPPLEDRTRQLRAIVDAYGLSARPRRSFVDLMIELVVHETAAEADMANVAPDTKSADCDPQLVWALTWHARGAAWMMRNRRVLQNALA
jgi:hypothetical protein